MAAVENEDEPKPESPPRLEARQYGEVAAIYDGLMQGVPHPAWVSRIEREAERRSKTLKSALDVACGTGIVTELLWRRGYRPLYAFDISPAMVAIAQTKASSWTRSAAEAPRFSVQDAAELDLEGRTFDLLISLFDSINYILDPERLQQAFRRLYAHTAPGGMLAFDMNSHYALTEGLFTQSHWSGPVWHDWKAHWDETTEICQIDMDFWVDDPHTGKSRHFTEKHIQRAYAQQDILKWLAEAGFVRAAVYGNYGDRPPGPRTDRLLFIAEKDAAP